MMLQIVVEVAGTVCDANCSIFSQTVDRQRPPTTNICYFGCQFVRALVPLHSILLSRRARPPPENKKNSG